MNGCNLHNAGFSTFKNGQIVIGEFVSTKRQCVVDFDSLYLNALKNSREFAYVSNGDIHFFDASSQLSLILTPIGSSNPILFT